jgi:ribonuclease I
MSHAGLEAAAAANEAFDFYILSMYWPAATLPASAQARAKHLITRQEARPGFWTHGLWPVR